MPGLPAFDCPHADGIAVLVTLPGGDRSITCPRCASARVERALDEGVDETCIVITQESIAAALDKQPPNPEDEHRRRWPDWSDQRVRLSEGRY